MLEKSSGLVVGIFVGVLIASCVLPLVVNGVYFFDGGDIGVIRLSKVGFDRLYILPEPNDTKCKSVSKYLKDRFGSGWSIEKVTAEARIMELVKWYGEKKD